MKAFLIFLLTSLLIISSVAIGYFVIYPIWGRKLVYAANNKITKYPGVGRITQHSDETLFVVPKKLGRPTFELLADIDSFKNEFYDVYTIPSQQQLLYTVGNFESWEDIPGTPDKYIVIKNPTTKTLEKYRVAFETSDLFKDNTTAISVEDVSVRLNGNTENKITNPKINNLIAIGYLNTKQIIKKGDALILTPIFDPPELTKKDSQGNYLVSRIIVRRIGTKL